MNRKVLKVAFVSILLILFVGSSNAQVTETYDEFLEKSSTAFFKEADKLNKDFKIGTYPRWDFEQSTGELIFSDKGVAKVVAKVQIAGSYSFLSGTWKWSWDNTSIDSSLTKDMASVKKFGETNKFTDLTRPIFKCEETFAWTMTSVAGYITKAKGAYRGQNGDVGYVYFLITDIDWAKEGTQKL